jgi:tetratricopeptide (TPR) repeat protein
MHASRTLYRLWHSLRDAGLFRAAQWLAAGHIFARVRRRLPARRPFTIFVPHDAALVELAPAEAARLLSHGGAGLIAALRAHVAAGHYSPAPGDWLQESDDGLIRMMNGRRYTLGRRGIARIRRGPIRVDGIEIYIIDAPLIVAEMKAKAFGDLACRVAWNMRRSAKIGRAILIKALRRHPRAFACVRGLRERWGDWRYAVAKSNVSQSTIGMASNTESDVAELEANILCRRALAARTIAAVQRLYGFYNGVVLAGSGLSCRPAARLASIPSVDVQTVADWLVRAVEKAPQFAEVWLELGDVRTENGDTEGALAAYDQARTQPSMSVRQLGQSDPRAAAVLAWARLMEIRGRGAQACSGLDAMNLRGPWPWQLHFWRARMLVELGRSEEALDAFERSLEEGAWSGRFDPLLPRNPTDAEKALRVNSAATH